MSIRRYLAALFITSSAVAQSPISLRESNEAGRTYSVQSNVQLNATLTAPAEKGKASTISMTGRSSIVYDEKLMSPLPDGTTRSLRRYREAQVRRTINNVAQEATIRPSVSRMVILRTGTREVPFSPDGPLTFGEIDLVQTDVYTPALAGLLPAQPVQVGDTWPAAISAVEEITDIERIEQGGVECRLVSAHGRYAKIAFTGTVGGVNEDGPVRQQLEGHFTFDFDDKIITNLELTPVKFLLDKEGKTKGKIEGKFSLTRRVVNDINDLSDAAIKGLTLEPDANNTLLLYEGALSNIRFTYSRRWRVSVEQRQISLDGPAGNGLLLTVEPLNKVPAAEDYARESRIYIEKQKGRVLRNDAPVRIRPYPLEIDRFWMDVELNNQPARMEYAIVRQQAGGATVAARLTPSDTAALRPEFEQFVKSIQIGPVAPVGVVPLPGK